MEKLYKFGFKVPDLSINESFCKDGVFLIDVFSSSYAEAVFLGKNVLYIDSNQIEDEFVKYLRIVGRNFVLVSPSIPGDKFDRNKLCFSNCTDKNLLVEAIKQL